MHHHRFSPHGLPLALSSLVLLAAQTATAQTEPGNASPSLAAPSGERVGDTTGNSSKKGKSEKGKPANSSNDRKKTDSETKQSDEDAEDIPSPVTYTVETTTTVQPPPDRTVLIQGEDLEEEGVSSVGEALQLIPGAQTEFTVGGVNRISIDSLPSAHVQVLRDGVPFGRPSGGPNGSGVDFGSISLDPATIQRMEVIRGLGPNGSSGVVVNIISKKTTEFRASLTGRYGHAPIKDGSLRREITASFGLPLGVFAKSDETIEDPDATPPADNPTSSSSLLNDLNLNGQFGWNNRGSVDFDQDGSGDNPKQNSYFGTLGGGWNHEGSSLNAEATFQKGLVTKNYRGNLVVFDDLIGNTEGIGNITGKWLFDKGVIRHFSQYKYNRHSFRKLEKTSNTLIPKSITTSQTGVQNIGITFFFGDHDLYAETGLSGEWVSRTGSTGELKAQILNGAITVGDTWYVADGWDVGAEVRGTFSDPFGPQIEGVIQGGWTPSPEYKIRLSASRSRRVPTGEEMYMYLDHSEIGYQVHGNENLKPELLHSVKAEFGLRKDWFGVTLSPFFHHVSDGIVPSSYKGRTGEFTYTNADKLLIFGLTTTVEVDIPGNLRFRGNYTYTPIARLVKDHIKDSRIALRPEHSFRAELGGHWLDNMLTARTWVDGRNHLPVPKDLTQASETGFYEKPAIIWNASIGYRPLDWLKVGVDVRNILDQRNKEWGPVLGRYLMGTITISQEGTPFW